MSEERQEVFFEPPLLSWQKVFIKEACVAVLLNGLNRNLLKLLFCDKQAFITLIKGKRFHIKSFEQTEEECSIAYLKGLSFREAQEQRFFSLASYPWIEAKHFVFSLSKASVKLTKPLTLPILIWTGIKEQAASMSYLGEDQNYSLWQVKTQELCRLCLGARYLIKMDLGELNMLLCANLKEFKSKRQSLGLFLQASKSLRSFLRFRLELGPLSCPASYHNYLAKEEIVPLGNDIYLRQKAYDHLKRKLIALTKKFGGLEEEKLIKESGEEPVLTKIFLKHLRTMGLLEKSDGYYWYKEALSENLSPLARSLLKKVEEKAWEGLSLSSLTSSGERETLKALKRTGLVAAYEEENFYFSWQALDEFYSRLKRSKPYLKAELGDIKELFSISRKVAISFCETLQKKGIIKREDNIWTWVHT